MNNEILQAKDELIAVKAEMNGVDIDSPEFNADNWDSLKKSKARLTAKIEQLEAQESARQEQEELANLATTPAPKVAPQQGTSHVTGMTEGFATMENMGYSSAGELALDHINQELYGVQLNDSADGFKARRYKHYCDAQSIHHAAGTASTLTDGLEILPDLLPGIREYGQGVGVSEVMDAFSPISTNRKEVDYFINEDTYNVDGLTVTRVSEGGTLAPQNFSNKLERFRIHKVGIFSMITEEDLQNVPMLESRYMRRAPETIEVQKVQDIIAGTGTQMPIGFTSAQNTAKVTVNRITTGEIVYGDISNMEKQYKRNGSSNGLYFTNQSALAQLMNLTDNSGALIWKANRNDGITGSMMHGTLNGRPLVVSEDMPALGITGDLSLVNPDGYIFANHTSGIRFATSIHFYFDADARAFRWLAQYGGRPAFSNPYPPREGGEDLSHFVLLDATQA